MNCRITEARNNNNIYGYNTINKLSTNNQLFIKTASGAIGGSYSYCISSFSALLAVRDDDDDDNNVMR